MSYTINNTNGNVQAVIKDGQIDTSTSLQLLGKNFANYGDEIATNFLHLLEHFSNDTAPSNPVTGQIWYDTTLQTIKVYNKATTVWKVMSSLTVGGVAPGSPMSGDLWWDNVKFQLSGYNGSAWVLIGPNSPGTLGKSGQFTVQIPDNPFTANHTVIKEYIGNVLVAVHSKDSAAFVPQYANANAADMSAGFALIKPGINLSTAIGNILLNGTANNSLQFNSLSSTDFLRANVAALTTGALTVKTDSGITIGDGLDLLLNITNGQDINVLNQTANGNITISVSGTGQALLPNTYTPSNNFSLTTKSYVDTAVLSANSSVASQTLYRNGTNTITGNIAPDAGNTNVFTFGTSSAKFNNMYSTTFTGNLSGNVSGASAALTGNLSANNITSTNDIASTTLTLSGNASVTNINTGITGIYDIGGGANRFRNINAVTFNATNVNSNVFTGNTATLTSITLSGNIQLNGSTSGSVKIQPAAIAGSATYTLPGSDGTVGQSLVTNGSGVLSWATIIGPTSNGYGTRYVSTLAPSGGNDGDVWFQVT